MPVELQEAQIRTVVERATLAPSIHNTQPWRFVARPGVIDVYADRSRAVPAVDPTGRQLVVSVGAAVEFARLAVRAEGFACGVDVLPGGDPDLVARLTVDAPEPATAAEDALVRAMPRRFTDRLGFDDRPVPQPLLDDLRASVERYAAWLRPITDRGEIVTVATLVAHAESEEAADPAYREELNRWISDDERAAEGIPRAALDDVRARERAGDVQIRDFLREPPATPDDDAPPPRVEHPLVVLLGTDADEERDWVAAGRALGWLLLRATDAGLAASPVGQALDIGMTRRALATQLGTGGHPQMLLRLGYGHGHPATHRRPVDEVLSIG